MNIADSVRIQRGALMNILLKWMKDVIRYRWIAVCLISSEAS